MAWLDLPPNPDSDSSAPRTPPDTFSKLDRSDAGGVPPTLTALVRALGTDSLPEPPDEVDERAMTPRLAASCALTSRNADSSCSLLSTEGPIGDSSAISGGLDEERSRLAKPGFGLGGASCEV